MSFLNRVLDRPKSDKPYILLVVGHPSETATVPVHAKQKKSLQQISSFR
jgi:iodotyrosine deiodinase